MDSEIQRDIIGLNRTTALGCTHFFLGDIIGHGQFRTVFSNPHNPKTVIKYEHRWTSHNILEHEWWHEVKSTTWKRWFAPTLNLSGCGKFLIMAKTGIVLNWPTQLPRFMHDFKQGNFGMYKGRFVCHDYAGLSMVDGLPKLAKTKKVNWRLGND